MAHFVSKFSLFVSVTVASLYLQRLFTFLQVNFCIFAGEKFKNVVPSGTNLKHLKESIQLTKFSLPVQF